MREVKLINCYPPPSAIYRYANDIHDAIDRSQIFNICYNPYKWRTSHSGNDFFGIFGSHYFLNNYFYRFAFSRFHRQLARHIKSGHIVHYASQVILPEMIESGVEVVTFHDNPIRIFGTNLYHSADLTYIETLLEKRAMAAMKSYRRFRNVLTDSKYVKHSLMENGFEADVNVIYPAVSRSFRPLPDKEKLRRKLGLPTDRKLILSVSSNIQRKNLAAVKQVMERIGNSFQLVRIGTPIGNSINFLNIDDEKVNEVYNACDVLLFPTLEEGFGYPVVEAFATGLPVVSSNIDVINEVSAGAAILVDPMDISGLAAAVRDCVENKNEFRTKSLNMATKYSFEVFGRKLRSYYTNL